MAITVASFQTLGMCRQSTGDCKLSCATVVLMLDEARVYL